ncbi:MAG: Pyruvate-formate lyase-activating enzyme [uncultured bacterium]|nr:MAG: Pyruvate-formate lyase-activating enzyme [uncultured bacterium]
MQIGSLQKFSLVDYPGKPSAIIFTLGCNFRCPYCHNPELVLPEKYLPTIPLTRVLSFLKSRIGKLEAVVITGGEPVLQSDLIDVMKKIKHLGFLVKLDTNGSRPEILEKVIKLKLADYLAMDIKGPLPKYLQITGFSISPEVLRQSIKLIIQSGIDHEFRTTIVKSLTSETDLQAIGREIKGAKKYYLQKFVATKTNNPDFLKAETYSDEELKKFAEKLKTMVDFCGVR